MTSWNIVGWILLSVVLVEIAVMGWLLRSARKTLADVRRLRLQLADRIDELDRTIRAVNRP